MIRRIFSLNDPGWGRGQGSDGGEGGRGNGQRPPPRQGGDGPPDLDELWREFNRRLNGMFGRGRGGVLKKGVRLDYFPISINPAISKEIIPIVSLVFQS